MIASIVHLGNLKFVEAGVEGAEIANREELNTTARLLQVTPQQLTDALCKQVVAARGDIVSKEHNIGAALYTRDALAKVFIPSGEHHP